MTKNYLLQCGQSFEALNKINDLQQSHHCPNESFGVNWNEKEKSYNFIKNSCDSLHSSINKCCVKHANEKIITSSLDHIDKRIFVYQPPGLKNIRNKLEYDVYIMCGRLSYDYCQRVYFDYVKWS